MIPPLRGSRVMWICDFKISLVYIVTSRTVVVSSRTAKPHTHTTTNKQETKYKTWGRKSN